MAAAALTKLGTERMAGAARSGTAGQHGLGGGDGAPLERAAADGAVIAFRRHGHGGTRFARCRAAGGNHGDAGAGRMPLQRVADVPPDLHAPPPFKARNMASGVAGASSLGICPGFVRAMASKTAVQTEMPSISGGSPTALDR